MTTKIRAALLAALMVLSVFAGGLAFAGAASAALPESTDQTDEDPGTVTLNGSVTEERGDVATINATFNGTETGFIQIGSDDVGYNTTVAVRDGGDGHVSLRMNTFLAGRTDPTAVYNLSEASASDGDEIVRIWRHSEELSSPLEAANYTLATGTESVSTAGDGRTLATADDRRPLILQQRRTQGLTVWTAPRGTNTTNLSNVLQNVNQTSRIAAGDLVVVQLQASGIYGQLQGENVREQLYDESAGFMLTIAEAASGANQDALKMAMNSGAIDGVFTDNANNSLFVVVDTSETPNTVSGASWNWETGEQYVASWTLNESNPMIEANPDTAAVEAETAEQNFTLVEANVTFNNLQNGQLRVPASQSAQISGSTTLAPGSEITLRIGNAESSSAAFLKVVETTVGQNGSFSTTVNMSDVEPGTNFSVVVHASDDTELGQVEGVVQQAQVETETPGETETETAAPGETETPGETAAPGETETPSETETAAPGETETPGETTTATDTTTTSTGGNGGGGTQTTQQNTPGFGVVIALVALVAAALLAVRRDN